MRIRKLLRIGDINRKTLEELLDKALSVRLKIEKPSFRDIKVPCKKNKPVALIFLEPSTRTRTSFERACHLTGRSSIRLTGKDTSFEKGETLYDAVLNMRALGIEDFVIRTGEPGGLEILRTIEDVGVISGGDGVGEHPTQALLDLLTLLRFCTPKNKRDLKQLKGFKLGLVGDLRRSRVARSWSELAPLAGIDLTLISPPAWKPVEWGTNTKWTADFQGTVSGLDGVMALRVQKERSQEASKNAVSEGELQSYQLTAQCLSKKQFVLHPGPVNWGVEISQTLQLDARSLILEQVKSGLALRSTLIAHLG